MKKILIILPAFLITIISIQLSAFDLSDDRMEDLRIKYKAKIVDGILKVKDRIMLYQAGEDLLKREFENESIKIEAVFQPPQQIDNRMNYLLTTGKLNEFSFFEKLYGDEGIFTKHINKIDYLYFAFRIIPKTGQEIDTDKFIKQLKLYDGMDNKVKGEKPKLFKYDKEKNKRVYEDKYWTTLPGFEGKDFIWVAFPKEKLKEEAGVYCITIKKINDEKNIELIWTLPVKLPECRC